ncbi:hypothetical protein EC988_002195 [Linderina pennispora]|nr:hypothetical protein EC988_002195 [Linderina pennispora]
MDDLFTDILPKIVVASDREIENPARTDDIGAGIIAPFHSPRTPAQKLPRGVPGNPGAAAASAKDHYSKVRRRSPLCHDVLEFMLENASMSSLDSQSVHSRARECSNINHIMADDANTGLNNGRMASSHASPALSRSRPGDLKPAGSEGPAIATGAPKSTDKVSRFSSLCFSAVVIVYYSLLVLPAAIPGRKRAMHAPHCCYVRSVLLKSGCRQGDTLDCSLRVLAWPAIACPFFRACGCAFHDDFSAVLRKSSLHIGIYANGHMHSVASRSKTKAAAALSMAS